MIIVICKVVFLIMMVVCFVNKMTREGKPSEFFKMHRLLGGCVGVASTIGCASIFIS